MTHRYRIGQSVYLAQRFSATSSRALFKIVRLMPIENDDRVRYRIKSQGEAFDRVADEGELTLE
jgi:hypothetical protein